MSSRYIVIPTLEHVFTENTFHQIWITDGISGIFRFIAKLYMDVTLGTGSSILTKQGTSFRYIDDDSLQRWLRNQVHRNFVSRLQRWWRRLHYQPIVSVNDVDLCANPFISDTGEVLTPYVDLSSGKVHYRFSREDIEHLICTALEAYEYHRSFPVEPKHPYMNRALTLYELQIMYTFVSSTTGKQGILPKSSDHTISDTFRLYRMCSFDMSVFQHTFKKYIQKKVCHRVVREDNVEHLYYLQDAMKRLQTKKFTHAARTIHATSATYFNSFLGNYLYYRLYLLDTNGKSCISHMKDEARVEKKRLQTQLRKIRDDVVRHVYKRDVPQKESRVKLSQDTMTIARVRTRSRTRSRTRARLQSITIKEDEDSTYIKGEIYEFQQGMILTPHLPPSSTYWSIQDLCRHWDYTSGLLGYHIVPIVF